MENVADYETMTKLDLSTAERQKISDLADMLLDSFNEFTSVDTAEEAPMYTVLDLHNLLREDISVKMLSREELLSNAPMQYDGFFQVPKTL